MWRCWPATQKKINVWHLWFGSVFATLMPRPSKKNNQPAALLASYDATSKKNPPAVLVVWLRVTSGIGDIASSNAASHQKKQSTWGIWPPSMPCPEKN